MHVLIIGAGEIGSALTHVLKKKRNVHIELEQWDKNPDRVRRQRPLKAAVPAAGLVFLCVPSWAVRDALKKIKRFLCKDTVVVSFAKGVSKSGRAMDELLKRELPKQQPFALVSGPMLAEELMKDRRGAGMCAASPRSAFTRLKNVFRGTALSLRYTPKLHALALAGVLKNVYALALGIADGLNQGANGKGDLAAQAVEEMGGILALLAKGRGLAWSAAGLGDLLATGYSKYSRNRLAGENLAKGKGIDRGSEGVASLAPLFRLLGARAARFPLLTQLKKIVLLKKSPKDIF
ncbi:hypothetical protein COU12_01950 [Candidatus Jorgensenbacteria bacterium CG10_big_fil_rev_8_21_14_0_10_54_38]|uniref:Glycerol-3-phosphate dehydrogenase n=1 Tax=Candidatus Jorgensenbacteria bacterium CG10_big_fil_rev_8_21_14_0_10_54_38 TaxID=1974593 RepID=A0A2M6WFR7_9BACT|nr:MAG: hypothetical protein COU12_01950 [Candidatus Jorgensenbacteria bacterium CG10_big_fil_rev_8_21_14_0_10_54_38]